MDKKLFTRQQVKRYASEFVQHLRQDHGLAIKEAYIFGSYAKKSPRNWSDIDVCVISPRFSRTDALSYLWRRRRDVDIDRGIEPYGLAPEDFVEENPVASEVKKYGVKIPT